MSLSKTYALDFLCISNEQCRTREKKTEQSQTIVGFVQRKLALDGRMNNNNESSKNTVEYRHFLENGRSGVRVFFSLRMRARRIFACIFQHHFFIGTKWLSSPKTYTRQPLKIRITFLLIRNAMHFDINYFKLKKHSNS